MNEIADRYRRLSARLSELVAAVPPDRWDAASPCEGWTARDVLEHVADSQREFLGRFDFDSGLPEGGDAPQRWRAVRDRVQEVLDDPARAATTFEGFFGPTTVEETVDSFYASDLVVHPWDIARATGRTEFEAIPPDEAERVLADLPSLPEEALRSKGIYGPAVAVPDDADAGSRLLAFTGRRP